MVLHKTLAGALAVLILAGCGAQPDELEQLDL
jgi:hypothetical protein